VQLPHCAGEVAPAKSAISRAQFGVLLLRGLQASCTVCRSPGRPSCDCNAPATPVLVAQVIWAGLTASPCGVLLPWICCHPDPLPAGGVRHTCSATWLFLSALPSLLWCELRTSSDSVKDVFVRNTDKSR
jgi:hypothetical protein